MSALALMYDELSEVTPEMVAAGIKAALEKTTVIGNNGQRQPLPVTAYAEYEAIYQAMLRTKLSSPA